MKRDKKTVDGYHEKARIIREAEKIEEERIEQEGKEAIKEMEEAYQSMLKELGKK
jgi:hypothetical protein